VCGCIQSTCRQALWKNEPLKLQEWVITRRHTPPSELVGSYQVQLACIACCSRSRVNRIPHLTVQPTQEAPPARCPHARQQRLSLCAADEHLAGRARRAVGTAMLLMLRLALLLLPLQP
jgi:hypothetical protein